jgi:hypothetical protein
MQHVYIKEIKLYDVILPSGIAFVCFIDINNDINK